MPSEVSLVSDTSSCEAEDARSSETSEADKIFRRSEARPLVLSSVTGPASPVTSADLGTEKTPEAEAGEDEARLLKAQAIAGELVKTEAHYVAILHLIDQVLQLNNKVVS